MSPSSFHRRFRRSLPPSLHRVPSGRFPGFIGTTGQSDFSPPISRRFVSFASRYRLRGGDESSQVPGRPSRTCRALRPRWDRCARPSGALPYSLALRCCLPLLRRRRLPRLTSFGAQSHGPHTRCLRFAARVAPGPRKTRFRLVALLGRAGLQPAGSKRKASATSSAFSFPRLHLAHRRPGQGCGAAERPRSTAALLRSGAQRP